MIFTLNSVLQNKTKMVTFL